MDATSRCPFGGPGTVKFFFHFEPPYLLSFPVKGIVVLLAPIRTALCLFLFVELAVSAAGSVNLQAKRLPGQKYSRTVHSRSHFSLFLPIRQHRCICHRQRGTAKQNKHCKSARHLDKQGHLTRLK